MPFTFAHPAIALLFQQKRKHLVSYTGLIVGSMLPDFEYFIRMNLQSKWFHSQWGIWMIDLPLGILLCFLFHRLVKPVAYANLPLFLKSRMRPFMKLDGNYSFSSKGLILIVSLLIGIYSHVVWDSFTHETGYFVRVFPFLISEMELLGFTVPIFKMLQHGSTLIGGILIINFIFKLPPEQLSRSPIQWSYWIGIVIIVIIILIVRFFGDSTGLKIGNLIVSSIGAFFLSILIVSAAFCLLQNKHAKTMQKTDLK